MSKNKVLSFLERLEMKQSSNAKTLENEAKARKFSRELSSEV